MMYSDYEAKLEAEIELELQGLPELAAPATLVPRVMAALACAAAVRWYRRPWENWPLAARAAAFALLLAVFGGLCLGSRQAIQSAGFTLATGKLGELTSSFDTAQSALNAIAVACILAIRQLGTGFLVGLCAAVALGYALCLGLGTLCVRLAFARRWQ
jgi:hypothetical protein